MCVFFVIYFFLGVLLFRCFVVACLLSVCPPCFFVVLLFCRVRVAFLFVCFDVFVLRVLLALRVWYCFLFVYRMC